MEEIRERQGYGKEKVETIEEEKNRDIEPQLRVMEKFRDLLNPS